ncbi:MAG: TonB-dependent receptor [Mangrovibacterium sp.]
MKKKQLNAFPGKSILKIMRVMKLVSVLLLATFFQATANSYSQSVRIDLSLQDVRLVDALKAIQKKTDLAFLYSMEDIRHVNVPKIDLQDATLEKVMEELLEDTGLSYQFVEEGVIIRKEEKPVSAPLPLKTEQQDGTVKGKVTDPEGAPLPGATITVVGTTRGVITDTDGSYSIEAGPRDKLTYSFIGMESQIVEVGNQKTIDIQLKEKVDELEEVTIVAFGKQKKESVISSISTVNVNDLRVPASNLTTAFAGRIAGIISYQTSGEPGYDDAEFFVRGVTSFGTGKVNPLILIDNVEMTSRDLARLHPDDIESFSILKDAAATALYGARGANGVVMVKTKEGKEGKTKLSFRFENSFSSPTSTIDMAEPVIYMKMANEAVLARNSMSPIPYRNDQIDLTGKPGSNPYYYPAVDWKGMLIKDVAINQRANMNISGGGKVSRYYIALSFTQDNGILKVPKLSNYNSNVNLKQYLVHSNVNINLTPSTEAIVRVHGTFEDYTGPISGGSDIFKKIMRVSPSRFPAYYAPDETYANVNHILFGNDEDGQYMNPYAELVKGYKEESKSTMLAQIELKQDFGQWIKGLTGRLLGNTIRNAAFDLSRAYSPYYYDAIGYNRFTDTYELIELNPNNPNGEFLSYSPGAKNITSSFYGEASLAYDRTFNEKHAVNAMLVGTIRNALSANAAADAQNTALANSLPERNLGLAGRVTWAYDSRYFTEFNFGYNGSEKFDKNHRWGFFPSAGLGWFISNEKFWSEGNISSIINKLKLRGTYGVVGNDAISNRRFFYISQVAIGGGDPYQTGYNYGAGLSYNGVKIVNYPNAEIGWERSYKTNLGLEVGLFNKIEMQVDIFKERRTNILQPRADIPYEMGLWSTPEVNVGQADGKGVDLSIDYNQSFSRDAWITGRANFTYARSTYRFYEEPNYEMLGAPWRSRKGYPVSQSWGFVAERLFIDDADIATSPVQEYGEVMPGDIKYKDMNKDGFINDLDKAPIGYPTTPEINYGFGLSVGYKNFDVSVFFQGSGRYSFFIDYANMTPFVQRTENERVTETGVSQFIADDYWSETTQNPHAFWPRLSNYVVTNNAQTSTWWVRNGSFLRLKSVELGYSLPTWANKLKMKSCRIYLSGTNLLLFSNFKTWDIELAGNGLNYPLQRVINIGINLTF